MAIVGGVHSALHLRGVVRPLCIMRTARNGADSHKA